MAFSYYAGESEDTHSPLVRFLPNVPKGAVAQWLTDNIPIGSIIFDPIGSNPYFSIEAASAGYRILMVRNNPILWLWTETLSRSPTIDNCRKVINRLLESPYGDSSLEDHLYSLYQTPCNNCQQMVQVYGYIWEKDKNLPTTRIYECPFCGESGEKQITTFDLDILDSLSNINIHRSRAVARIGSLSNYERQTVQEAIACYLPRALYVIVLLINKLDGLSLPRSDRLLLMSLLISVFDQGNVLWHWPEDDWQPRQLFIPARFLEKNLYSVIKNLQNIIRNNQAAIPISYWPNLPPRSGGICFYNRRLDEKQMLHQIETPKAVIAVLPRPNQAFWTLSVIWSAWLLRKKAINNIRAALERRRYDWFWFSKALNAAFSPLTKNLPESTPLYALFPNSTPANLTSSMIGCRLSSMNINDFAYRIEEKMMQSKWSVGIPKSHQIDLEKECKKIIRDYLLLKGEPATSDAIVYATIGQLTKKQYLPINIQKITPEYHNQLMETINTILQDSSFLRCFSIQKIQGDLYWFKKKNVNSNLPLSDKIEETIIELLQKHVTCRLADIDREICNLFPSLLTPEQEIIKECLKSYADFLIETHQYKICEVEKLNQRNKDIVEIQSILEKIGLRLGYQPICNEKEIQWLQKSGKVQFVFFLSTTASLGWVLKKAEGFQAKQCVMVFPGSRSHLIAYKLTSNPIYKESFDAGWHFLKFRYVRKLFSKENLIPSVWDDILDSDPPLWDPPQQLQIL